MKSLIKTFGILLVCANCFINTTHAQSTKADKKTVKIEAIKNIINKMNYVFKANYVNPFRGGGKVLTADYDVKVTKDKIDIDLPFFGRAYSAPIDPNDAGITLTSTHFDYKATQNKKGDWDIVIKPNDKKMLGAKDVQQLRFTISPDGFGSLQVTSFSRDPISFNGDIEELKKEK